MSFDNLIQALKGGSGSGNFGHSGRPGKVGGSAGGGKVQMNLMSKADADKAVWNLRDNGYDASSESAADVYAREGRDSKEIKSVQGFHIVTTTPEGKNWYKLWDSWGTYG